jgi:hypothetical protein
VQFYGKITAETPPLFENLQISEKNDFSISVSTRRTPKKGRDGAG